MCKSKLCCCCCLGRRSPGFSQRYKKDHRSSLKVDFSKGLSAEDTRIIQNTYDFAFKKMHIEQKGAEFMVMLFVSFPEYQKFFKAFKDVPLEEIFTLPVAKNHGRSVITTIGTMVEHLGSPDEQKEDLKKILKSHLPRGITVSFMKDLLEVFVEFLKECIGPKFTLREEETWVRLMNIIQISLEEVESRYIILPTPVNDVRRSSLININEGTEVD